MSSAKFTASSSSSSDEDISLNMPEYAEEYPPNRKVEEEEEEEEEEQQQKVVVERHYDKSSAHQQGLLKKNEKRNTASLALANGSGEGSTLDIGTSVPSKSTTTTTAATGADNTSGEEQVLDEDGDDIRYEDYESNKCTAMCVRLGCKPNISPETRTEYWKEAKVITKLGAPVVFTYFLQMSVNLITLFGIGHAGGAFELSAAALGSMFINVTGMSIGFGITSAMDTLSSQAFGSNNKSHLVGTIFQRAMALLTLVAIPIALAWWFSGDILIGLRQDYETARLAEKFIRYCLPGLLPLLIFESFKKYLNTQGIMVYPMYAFGLSIIQHIILTYVLIFPAGLGFLGGPIAVCLTYISLPIYLLFFVLWRGLHKDTWGGWSKQALHGWWEFLKLGIPGMMMMCNEWWAFEIVTLLSGLMGSVPLASTTVVLSTSSLVYSFTLGISVAVTTRVGNLLGSRNHNGAKRAAQVGIAITTLLSLITFTLLMSLRKIWGYMFTREIEVVQLVGEVLAVYALFHVFDNIQAVSAGVIRGCGKQLIGALYCFIGFYVVGLPLGISLAFPAKMGLHGLWWGLAAGLFVLCICYLISLYRLNWKKEADKAQLRIQKSNEGNNSGSTSSLQMQEIDGDAAVGDGTPADSSMKTDDVAEAV